MDCKNVLILTEAGKNIGFGHLTRCTALRDTLVDNDTNTDLVVYVNEFCLETDKIREFNWLENIDKLNIAAYEIVIVDSYLAGKEVYGQLKKMFKHVVAIDDYNRITYDCDLIINPNVFFDELNYKNQKTVCIGGKDYVILRKEFRDSVPKKQKLSKVENILVTIGGSDFRNILPTIIDVLNIIDLKSVKVITSEKINIIKANSNLSIIPNQSAGQFLKLIKGSDLVVSACGQTLHELASQGQPTVGICLDIDQKHNQRYYLDNKFLHSEIHWNEKCFKENLLNSVMFFDNPKNRQTIAIDSVKLINRNGIENIVNKLKSLL